MPMADGEVGGGAARRMAARGGARGEEKKGK
jgi:hypothetical protein